MPKYTLETIRATARARDIRLDNQTKYPNSWIDDRIAEGFETAESGRQVFSNEESIDLRPYINDGVEQFLFEASEEVHTMTQIVASVPSGITTRTNNDETVTVTLDIDNLEAITDELTLSFRYYYTPKLGFTEIFMKPEIYSYFKDCMFVDIFSNLRDKESEAFHQRRIDRFIQVGSFGIENDFDEFLEMNPNFSLIGLDTWE